jgi:hypothetical protein
MKDKYTDIEMDISALIDRGESPDLMEPLLISQGSRHVEL